MSQSSKARPQPRNIVNGQPSFQVLTSEVPFSQEAEEALLGAVLTGSNPLYLECSGTVATEDIYIERHRYIWEAFRRLHQREETIDTITVAEELKAMNVLVDSGGPAYLIKLINAAADHTHAPAYAGYVARLAGRRAKLEALDRMRTLVMSDDVDYDTIHVEGYRIWDAAGIRESNARFLAGTMAVERYEALRADIQARVAAGQQLSYPLPDKISALAEKVGRLAAGLTVISGPSGSGKSALSEQLAEHFGLLGVPVEYMYTEMTEEDFLHRRMARHSHIPYWMLLDGEGGQEHIDRARAEIEVFTPLIDLHGLPDTEFENLQVEMLRAAESGKRVIILDHFQDVRPPDSKAEQANLIRAMENMVTWLNAFAEKRNIVLIVVSQQNEKGDTAWTKKLIQKCRLWISLRPEKLSSEYNYRLDGVEVRLVRGDQHPVIEMMIGKNRFGKKGAANLLYHGPYFEFMDTRFAFFDVPHKQSTVIRGRDRARAVPDHYDEFEDENLKDIPF